jgi:hypothetical protein
MPEPNAPYMVPRRRREPTGRVPTLGQMRQHTSWVWLNCAARGCEHHVPFALAPAIVLWGPQASSDTLRRAARCTECGGKGASLQHPSHVSSVAGLAPFPVTAPRP